MSELQNKIDQVVKVLAEAVRGYSPVCFATVWALKIWY